MFTIVNVAALMIAICPSSAMAQKLTGGAEWTDANGIVFSVTANAVMTPKGIKGNIQYTREDQTIPDLSVHAAVECFGVSADGQYAVAAGPAVIQYNPNGLTTGDYLIFAVKEGGTGDGDRVRVWFDNEATANSFCTDPASNTTFPGHVYDGNFTLRPE